MTKDESAKISTTTSLHMAVGDSSWRYILRDLEDFDKQREEAAMDETAGKDVQFPAPIEPERLEKALRGNQDIPPRVRTYLADVVTGKIKHKRGRRKSNEWNKMARRLLIKYSHPELKLASKDVDRDGRSPYEFAVHTLADQLGMSESAVVKELTAGPSKSEIFGDFDVR